MALDKKQTIAYMIYGLILVGSLVYIIVAWFGVPVWRYFPVLGIWNLSSIPGEISMGYYGKFILIIPITLVIVALIGIVSIKTNIFSGSEIEENIFRGSAALSVFIAFIYYIGHESADIIVADGGIDATANFIGWTILLLIVICATVFLTKLATKSVIGEESQRGVI